MAGVEELLGVHGHGFWMNLMEMFNQKCLRRVLERNPEMYMDDSLFQEERKIEYKHSISTSQSSALVPFDRSNSEIEIQDHPSPERPSGIPLLNVSTLNGPTVPPVVVNVRDFSELIPHAKRIKPRRYRRNY